MTPIQFVPPLGDRAAARRAIGDRHERARVLADACRINALSMIAYAGSGHVGTSFSAMDLVCWLWTEELRDPAPEARGGGDRYFSSKGHDVPGLYALLIGARLPRRLVPDRTAAARRPARPPRSCRRPT